MQSFTYEEYRKELNRYNDIVVYAVVRKNFLHEDDHDPLYSLDIDVEILPKTDEEMEKTITSKLIKSSDFDTIIECFNKIDSIIS
ncbi:MAG TPA: hypothetical protein GX740_04245 [Acholeplasmataceae bacterium]|nr:hypothetical protein [Acholeplasmataceae bacterium]